MLPGARMTRTTGCAATSAAIESSRDRLSTTTSSIGPALVSASNDPTHSARSGPASKFTTTAAQRECSPCAGSGGSEAPSVAKAELHEGPQRCEAVAPRDLLAFVELTAHVRDRDLVDADPSLQDLRRDLGFDVEVIRSEREIV